MATDSSIRRAEPKREATAVGAILISGIPGSGKTTIARLVAAEFERAAHLEGDVISFQFIVSGLVPPEGPPLEEAWRQLELRR